MKELIFLPGVLLTFLLCIILRMSGAERPGLLFFMMMSGMMGLLVTIITVCSFVWLRPDLFGAVIIMLAYALNAALGQLLLTLGGN